MVHTGDPSAWDANGEDGEFKASLGYIARLVSEEKKSENEYKMVSNRSWEVTPS